MTELYRSTVIRKFVFVNITTKPKLKDKKITKLDLAVICLRFKEGNVQKTLQGHCALTMCKVAVTFDLQNLISSSFRLNICAKFEENSSKCTWDILTRMMICTDRPPWNLQQTRLNTKLSLKLEANTTFKTPSKTNSTAPQTKVTET